MGCRRDGQAGGQDAPQATPNIRKKKAMETFLEWLRLSEANANDRTLINYALRIESDPKLDDLETMLSMLKTHSEGLWPLGAIGMLLIRMKTVAEKLPEPDRSKALKSVGDAKKEIEENINSTRAARRDMISGKNLPKSGGDAEVDERSGDEFIRDLQRKGIPEYEWESHIMDRFAKGWGATEEEDDFFHDVKEYLKNVFFIDLEAIEEEDAKSAEKAHGIILQQWDSGERDFAAAIRAALKVKELLG